MFDKTNTHTQKTEKQLAELFLARVSSHLKSVSDPAIMQKIFDDLKIDSFYSREKRFNTFASKITNEPVSLIPIIERFKKGLLDNPALCKLLATIERDSLISDNELEKISPQLQVQLNFLYLFEAVTVTMMNSATFSEDIYRLVVNQRKFSNPGNPVSNLFFASGLNNFSMFKNLKLVSVDPAMTAGAFVRSLGDETNIDSKKMAQLERAFIKKHGLSLWNTRIHPYALDENSEDSVRAVSLNVMEAMWEETVEGRPTDNVLSGAALIKILEHVRPTNNIAFKNTIIPAGATLLEGDRYDAIPDLAVSSSTKWASEFNLSKDWMDLYNSWDLLFVINKLDSQFLPIKLLIPSVLDAIPEQYMETRVFSLFLIGNLFHQNKLSMFPPKTSLRNEELILKKWGEINKNFANEVLDSHCPDLEGMSLEDIFTDIFGDHPNLSLMKQLTNYIRQGDNFQITSKSEPRPTLTP